MIIVNRKAVDGALSVGNRLALAAPFNSAFLIILSAPCAFFCMMKIMFSAGEVSGDIHGAALAREILKIDPTVELLGFGGDRMSDAGVKLVRNCKDFSIMGVLEVIKNLRRIFRLLDELTECMKNERPDLLVLIDYPDFNWRLARRAKKLGIKVFSYIPPSAWAWRKGRAKDCAAIADQFAAIFPFEVDVYRQAGANITFVGNPLVDTVKPSMSAESARNYFNVGADEHVILLMPGSRRQEIKFLLEPMLDSARKIIERRSDVKFYLPVADGVDRENLTRAIVKSGVEVRLVGDHRYDLMSIADCAAAASGTVILEAALLGMPCVVLYKMAALNYWVAKRFVHIDNFSLPNILLGKKIQPELLQDAVEPDRISTELLRLLRGSEHRARVVEELKAACDRLGGSGAAHRTARLIINAAKGNA